MKRLFILLGVCMICSSGLASNYGPTLMSVVPTSADAIVVRKTVRLYWSNECITLYPNGKCLLTQGDNIACEGTYSIEDEGNWLFIYFVDNGGETHRVACKCRLYGGSVVSLSYNGYQYKTR